MKRTLPVPLFGAACALFSSLITHAAFAADTTDVRVLHTATTTVASGFYAPNRPPLQATAFLKLPIGSIAPKGWMRHQLELDANGLCGRLPEISHFLKFDDTGWVNPDREGWEEAAYWLRGYGDLAYVLHDEKM